MTNTVEVVHETKDDATVKAIERQTRLVDRLAKRLDNAGDRGGRAGKRTETGFAGAGRSALQMAGSIGIATSASELLQAAVRAIAQEWRQVIALQEKSRSFQVDLSSAVRGARVNLGIPGEAELRRTTDFESLEAAVESLGGETGADQKVIATALSTAFSARGNASVATAIDAVRQAARVFPSDQEAITTLSSAALDVADKTGETNIQAILGQVTQAAASSRITSPQQFAAAAIPFVSAAATQGETSERGLELFTALNILSKEESGQQTSTAGITLLQQLEEFSPQREIKQQRGDETVTLSTTEEERAAFAAAETPSARIAAIQQSENLRAQFLAGATFRAKLQAPIEQLLAGDAQALGALSTAETAIGGVDARAVRSFESLVDHLDRGKFEDAARVERDVAGNVEQFRTQTVEGLKGEVRRVVLEQSLENVNFAGAIDATIDPFFKVPLETRLGMAETPAEVARAGVRTLHELESELRGEGFSAGGTEAELELVRRNRKRLTQLLRELERREAEGERRAPEADTEPEGRESRVEGRESRAEPAANGEQTALLRDIRDELREGRGGPTTVARAETPALPRFRPERPSVPDAKAIENVS